jgi:hypothetical protein
MRSHFGQNLTFPTFNVFAIDLPNQVGVVQTDRVQAWPANCIQFGTLDISQNPGMFIQFIYFNSSPVDNPIKPFFFANKEFFFFAV